MATTRAFHASVLAVGVLLLCIPPLAAQDQNTYIQHAVRFAVSPPLRDLARLPQSPQYGFHEASPVRRIPKRSVGRVVDKVKQRSVPDGAAYSIDANFLGVGNGFPNYSVNFAPPDTNMAVGDTQIVQWVNLSYTVCSKTPPYPCGPAILGENLWSNLGGACAANASGDIIAQWDVQAHRWLLAQNLFTAPYGVCLAVSTSNDATGSYYLYQFNVVGGGFPDYPKWGIWVNNYGQTWNNFGADGMHFVGPAFCAYNRTKLLAGDTTAEQICHQYLNTMQTPQDSLLPADIDSPTLPPAGEDQFAIGSVGDVDNSHLSVYSVHVNNPNDWTQGATFTGNNDSQLVAIATFNPACNGNYDGNCVPQFGVSDLLDSLGGRLMYRFVYYQDATLQHWYVNFDVAASDQPGSQNGVRWMEFMAPNSVVQPTDISILQQGTYAPDGNWRWMGSIARDQNNDVLLGYSESNTSMYPSIFIAGRTPSDPLNTLESEVAVVNGTGSQIGSSNRWGDYSAMRIDPVDNCTFWYTTEYYLVTQEFDWSTQIAAANFASCPSSISYTLTVSPTGNGTVTSTDGSINCPGTCSSFYPSNTQVTLNATPAAGWTFSGWSGACSGTGACVVVMTQNQSVGATFTQLSYTLTVSPTGNGTVTSTDGSINCPGTCSSTYPSNTPVTLNATPGQGWRFGGWSGPCSGTGPCNLIMTQNLLVGATFFQNGVLQQFVPVTPCRLVDTRQSGNPIQGGTSQNFTVPQLGGCNIPSSSAAYSLNVTVVPHGTLGYLTVWPTGEVQPDVSTLNSDGRTKANAAIVLAGTNGAISVYASNTTDLILDIDGYFTTTGALAFYPLTPCRVADTRGPTGPLGGPFLKAKLDRDFPVLDATSCNIPSSALVYSLNFTAVPHGSLVYLTVCPTPSDPSQSCPVVSTLNSYGGQVTANAAIVPAGVSGDIRVYPSNDTDLIIDINGYFAPPATGGLSLYSVVPCRVLDTRSSSGGNGPFQFELEPPVDVLGSPCGVPSQSLAYVFNATVVPQGPLDYLALWPDGQNRPVVSTLNAYDGVITSNMAIVPAGTNGEVDAYANPVNKSDPTDLTNLILDISGYFAP